MTCAVIQVNKIFTLKLCTIYTQSVLKLGIWELLIVLVLDGLKLKKIFK